MLGDVLEITFESNQLVAHLFAVPGSLQATLQSRLAVHVAQRGNRVALYGANREERGKAGRILETLYELLEKKGDLEDSDILAAFHTSAWTPDGEDADAPGFDHGFAPEKDPGSSSFQVGRSRVRPLTPAQAQYMRLLATKELLFALGPAGTGKTYLAVLYGLKLLAAERVARVVFARPAIEAGERLGFLPGDLRDKLDPFFRPIYDVILETWGGALLEQRLAQGVIEIAPLGFMRGRTLKNAFILLDEAQNATPDQLKMFLTRLGAGSRMVVTGDPEQADRPRPGPREGTLPAGQTPLTLLAEALSRRTEIGLIRFQVRDVTRHPLVRVILDHWPAALAGASASGGSAVPPDVTPDITPGVAPDISPAMSSASPFSVAQAPPPRQRP